MQVEKELRSSWRTWVGDQWGWARGGVVVVGVGGLFVVVVFVVGVVVVDVVVVGAVVVGVLDAGTEVIGTEDEVKALKVVAVRPQPRTTVEPPLNRNF